MCLHVNWIKRTWPAISSVVSKLKDFSRSQTLTYSLHKWQWLGNGARSLTTFNIVRPLQAISNVICRNFSYSYTTVDRVLAAVARRAVPSVIAELFVSMCFHLLLAYLLLTYLIELRYQKFEWPGIRPVHYQMEIVD